MKYIRNNLNCRVCNNKMSADLVEGIHNYFHKTRFSYKCEHCSSNNLIYKKLNGTFSARATVNNRTSSIKKVPMKKAYPKAHLTKLASDLRDARLKMNLRQIDMAKMIGCSFVSYNTWEKAKRRPLGHHLHFIVNFINQTNNGSI